MSDYSEHGAVPIDDAAVEDPPTVEEVLEAQRRNHPQQAATSTMQPPDVSPDAADPAGSPEPRRRGRTDEEPNP
jgi:hypothetical protein